MNFGKKCIKCGRKMYKNDICKPCERELFYENLRKSIIEQPEKKKMLETLIELEKEKDKIRKQYRNESYKRYEYHGIANKLRSKVRNLLKTKTDATLNSQFDLIGCAGNELKSNLEKQFKNGMSWNNYGIGGWHIEHIIPCQAFDLRDPEEQSV